MIATDQEGGIVYRLGSGTALPGNMATGAAGDVRNAEISGQIIGSELDSVGINTTLAPVLDVNNNANNTVIGIRSFGDDPETVGAFGTEYIKGLNQYNIIGCAKNQPQNKRISDTYKLFFYKYFHYFSKKYKSPKQLAKHSAPFTFLTLAVIV
jgi:beta-glucosidase-like glycosyl hydrolase